VISNLQIGKKQTWLIVSGFWLVFYISRVLQDVAGISLQGYHADFNYIAVNYSGWLFWIPLTFLILRISGRFPIHKENFRRQFLIHFGFCLLIAAIHYAFEALMMFATTHFFFPGHKGEAYLPYMLYSLHLPILIYFLIVAIHQGVHSIMNFQKETLKTVELESKLVEAQNSALKMQIQPHFLFNTHHSIVSLVAKGENEIAIKMLNGLSELLRKTLELPKNLVSVDEEITFIKLYLDIQAIRFKNRLQIGYSIDSESRRARVPAFILQPIIENAIVHGIEPFSDSGKLSVQSSIVDKRLRLVITDDGTGVKSSFKEGIGLSNVRSRLINQFEKDFMLLLEKREPKGTIVILSLPLIFEP